MLKECILLTSMATFISHNPDQTFSLGEAWAAEAQRGWVLGLSGDLGAGKTQLVKGLAKGLLVHARVQSPSFTLVNVYPGGRLPLFHLDLYRLQSPEQIIAAGLEPYLVRPQGVSVVEWIEKWLDQTPAPTGLFSKWRHARIRALSETDREITYEDFGG